MTTRGVVWFTVLFCFMVAIAFSASGDPVGGLIAAALVGILVALVSLVLASRPTDPIDAELTNDPGSH